ncbi:hypothetical protein Hanom_Chr07g00637071 [Helianthus anomalus]
MENTKNKYILGQPEPNSFNMGQPEPNPFFTGQTCCGSRPELFFRVGFGVMSKNHQSPNRHTQ